MIPRRLPPSRPLATRLLLQTRCNVPANRFLTTLAIETSCDDTAVAILSQPSPSSPARLLFNERITSDNTPYKGIHPLASTAGHSQSLGKLVQRAVLSLPPAQAQDGKKRKVCVDKDGALRQVPDFVSVTRGPGIPAALSVGMDLAKGLSVAWGVPMVGVHHMQAHALTPQLVNALEASEGDTLEEKPAFPFATLLVSGGHTQLVHSTGLTTHRIVANTVDAAIGNALDQAARLILPPEILEESTDVMYARVLESFAFPTGSPEEYAFWSPQAKRGNELKRVETGYKWSISLPCRESREPIFTFSGIYTRVQRLFKDRRMFEEHTEMPIEERRALARHVMAVCFRHVADRICIACEDKPSLREAAKTVVIAGGVASNKFLKHVLRETMRARLGIEVQIVAPPVNLCTDNAAMIAWTGMRMYEQGWHTALDVVATPKWPLDPDHGPGLLGVEGWLKRE